VDLSGVTSEIGRRSGAIDSAAGGRPGVLESTRASLTGAAPIRTGVRSADVGFRAALLDTKGPQPLYPTALQGTRRRGTATLEFTVDSSGRQYGVARVARADHPAFAQSVLDALPRMRFVPATENGTPVSQRVVMTFTFVPQDE
jgi:TonB family protein